MEQKKTVVTKRTAEEFRNEFVWNPKYFKQKQSSTLLSKVLPLRYELDKEACLNDTQILTQNLRMSLDKRLLTRNLNCLGIGVGKRNAKNCIKKPNIMLANSSYIVSDTNGELLEECGPYLKEQGYVVKVLNMKDLASSDKYNPLAYVENVECLEDFVALSVKKYNKHNPILCLYAACFAYQKEIHGTYGTFADVYNMFQNAADSGAFLQYFKELFESLPEDSYARALFKHFMISGNAYIDENGNKRVELGNPSQKALDVKTCDFFSFASYFDSLFKKPGFGTATSADNMEISTYRNKKTAVFLINPEGDESLDFLASMFVSQVARVLCHDMEEDANIPVRFLLDEEVVIPKSFVERMTLMDMYGMSLLYTCKKETEMLRSFVGKTNAEIAVCSSDVLLLFAQFEWDTCVFNARNVTSFPSISKESLKFALPSVVIDSDSVVVLVRGKGWYVDKKYEG